MLIFPLLKLYAPIEVLFETYLGNLWNLHLQRTPDAA